MSSTYCSAVDAGLFVGTRGQAGLCCSGSLPLGDIRKQSINEIFTSSKFNEIQLALKNNQTHDYCSSCNRIESQAAGTSQRSAFNKQFPDSTQRAIKLLDVRWSNVCNLTCRYCNVYDSSEWSRVMNIPIQSVDRDYTDSLFDEIARNKDNIESVYLLGGEPLMQKHNERLLDIVDPSVKIEMLTNLSVKLDKNKIYQKLKSFPNVNWILSFDNIGDRFEYVRAGAQWSTFTDNIKMLCDAFGNDHVIFHPVYTIWNALNLQEYYEFAKTPSFNFSVHWQMALPKGGLRGNETESFITFGHKQSIIDAAVKEIESVQVDDPVLNNIKQSLISNMEIPGKDHDFLTWTKYSEGLVPPNKSFEELWPNLNRLLQND
jgi:MoaA/NifB/PqqE/SkfB family radical SAM enzyme